MLHYICLMYFDMFDTLLYFVPKMFRMPLRLDHLRVNEFIDMTLRLCLYIKQTCLTPLAHLIPT